MKDSPILHFLKNFPPWIVLVALTVLFVTLYYVTKDVSYKEWVALSLAFLFTALGVRAATPQQANTGQTQTGDVNIIPEPPKVNPLKNATDEEIEKALEVEGANNEK